MLYLNEDAVEAQIQQCQRSASSDPAAQLCPHCQTLKTAAELCPLAIARSKPPDIFS